jgi:TPR repeat protein
MHGTGEGVPENFQMAYVFFSMAAAGGNQKAPRWRLRMAMPPPR